MIQQYRAIKRGHPDAILLFRLGDFYEMFFEDAEVAARQLEITLTTRGKDRGEPIPMCGVPHHSIDPYIARLVEAGHKVALCEQVEAPAPGGGIVQREVVKVITPGTFMDQRQVGAKSNRFIAAITARAGQVGLALMDLSTGQFTVSELGGTAALRDAGHELGRWAPSELIVDPACTADPGFEEVLEQLAAQGALSVEHGTAAGFDVSRARDLLLEHFGTASLEGFGCGDLPLAVAAGGALLDYVRRTQRTALGNITSLRTHRPGSHMFLDAGTRRNLELTRRLAGEDQEGTLLWVLDETVTAMGGRLTRQWVERPLLERAAIESRLDAVGELVQDPFLRADLRSLLRDIHDLERLVSRAVFGSANARDLLALGRSLAVLPSVAELLAAAEAPLLSAAGFDPGQLSGLAATIARRLVESPPTGLRDGGLLREGADAEVDRLRQLVAGGKNWILELEERERQRTGIRSLKVGYNRVFGYYLEVTRSNLGLVPEDYMRKQTLVNSERYVSEELKQRESEILGAEERLNELEYRLFLDLREKVAGEAAAVRAAAAHVAVLDALASLAEVAARNAYVRPVMEDSTRLDVRAGRHPVLERTLAGEFVPNDVLMDTEQNRLLVVTGPNMAGKSTYLRQAALITLLAQIGSWVPAKSAVIGTTDRIFTRIGAADDLARGQSTFMVEMNEVAEIMNHATRRSLVILDEVGRGTSTFDGLSIARAVAEHIHNAAELGCKTLFATHYHQLTELEGSLEGAKNYTVAVREQGSDIVFLRQIIRGGTDRSYGLHVARLAGLPEQILRRASVVLAELEALESDAHGGRPLDSAARFQQLSLVTERAHPLLEDLARLDVLNLTPLEALQVLHDLRARAAGWLGEGEGDR